MIVKGCRIYSSSSSSSPVACRNASSQRVFRISFPESSETYIVANLLTLITRFIGFCLGLVRFALFLIQSLPALTEDLADLAYEVDT